MKERAASYTPRIQRLLVLAWLTLLRRSTEDLALFPDEAVIPHPARLIVFARIIQQDATVWRHGHHPHFNGHIKSVRVDTGDPRDVGVTFEANLTVRNADGMQLTRMEIRGPAGPSVGSWESRPEAL